MSVENRFRKLMPSDLISCVPSHELEQRNGLGGIKEWSVCVCMCVVHVRLCACV